MARPPRRSLDALFTPTPPAGVEDLTEAKSIDVALLDPNPFQPRQHPAAEGLASLATSIRTHGVLQPLIVRAVGDRYQIVAGERRWRAAQQAGLTAVPCLLRGLDDADMEVLALLENIQREDLSPLDEARSYRRLMERAGLSVHALAERLGRHHSVIQDRLTLLDDGRITRAVESGVLGPTVAVEIAQLPDEHARTQLLERASAGTPVRVKDVKAARRRAVSAPPVADNPQPPRVTETIGDDTGGRGPDSQSPVADYPQPLSDDGTREGALIAEDELQIIQVLRAGQGRATRGAIVAALRADLSRLASPTGRPARAR